MKTKNTKLNIKNSYPLKTLTLDCQKTMMRELLMGNKLITSNDFKQPYLEHFKYNPNGTSIENGNVITGQFGVYKEDVFIRQIDDFDYQLKYPIVFEIESNENLSTSKEEIIISTKHDAFRDLLLIKETKNNGEIWFKVPNSVSSPNIELVIEDLKNQTGKRGNSCDEDEKAVLNHFKNFIKEIVEYQLKSGVEITRENICLYYEFIDSDVLSSYKRIMRNIIYNRKLYVFKYFCLVVSENNENEIHWKYLDYTKKYLGYSIFGVKDTLKPIDEYITQIKDSDAYKEYRFDNLVKTYDLSISHLKQLERELFADDSTYISNIDNLIYSALDKIADDFKLNVIDYIEDNYLQESTGLTCISDIEVIIKDGEYQGIFKEFESY